MLESNPFQLPCLQDFNLELLSLDHDYANHALEIHDTSYINTDHFELSDIEFVDVPQIHGVDENMMNLEFPFDDLEELELISSQEMENICKWLNGSKEQENDSSFSLRPSDCLVYAQPLTMPEEGSEINNQLSLNHLASAYGEAMENNQTELAEVITRRISQKVSPTAAIIFVRLLYYAFHDYDNQLHLINKKQQQVDYLKQECSKNIVLAFEAFYKVFPYGMVAHFTANSAILEAKPHDTQILHIVDFDIGEGVQWSSIMMSLPPQTSLIITAIKWGSNEDYSCSWRGFEDTKKRLQDFAESLGIMLNVEEIELQDLAKEMKRMRKLVREKKEWLVFNCMWVLPHMGRRRSRKQVMEFLAMAKDLLLLANYSGLVTFGYGGYNNYCDSFGSFFESYMQHYQALLESIESNFPIFLGEARLSMECLFLAPYVSSLTMMETWREIKEGNNGDYMKEFGFEGLRVSNHSLMEAKEMVRGGKTTLYGVEIDGESNNEMVLEWRGIPLVRVSAWRL